MVRPRLGKTQGGYFGSQCTHYGVWVHQPKFFGERLVDNKWYEFEIKNAQMSLDVQNNRTYGEFPENGILWKWNIKDLI